MNWMLQLAGKCCAQVPLCDGLIIIINIKNKQITFYFAEEGPCHGSEDIKKECNVNCFEFFFFSVFLFDVMGGKINFKLKELH
jgi:hypothetical protein